MTQEDKDLRALLSGFNPTPASSEVDFMARLQRQMEAVEAVKEYCRVERKRYRRAILISALAGVLAGLAAGLCLPLLLPRLAVIWSGALYFAGIAAATLGATFGARWLADLLPALPPTLAKSRINA